MAFLCRFLARLFADRAGNVLAIVGAGMIPLAMMIGSGIDISRAYMAKSRMQSACDAASLAARRVMRNDTFTSEVDRTGKEFFAFNYPAGIYGTEAFTPVITKPQAGVVRVTAASRIPTAVMNLFGFRTLPVEVSCNASLNFVNTDIVLVLDVTGSMNDTVGGSVKIQALRDAVLALYDELAPVQAQLRAQGQRLRYSIVPYSSTVNVGRLLYAQNPSYLRTNTTVPSRVANFNQPVYAANSPTRSEGWQIYNGTLTSSDCQTYVGQSEQAGGGPAPTPTTVTRYFGNSAGNGFSQSRNWGWSGAPDTSNTYRSCRRWRVVETTTYETRYSHSNWTYRQVSFDVSNYIKPSGSLTFATSAVGTVPTAGSYNAQQLAAIGSGTSTAQSVWNGCIEERDTTTSIDGGSSLSIPSAAKDLNINLIPSDDSSRWRPMVPDLLFTRNVGSTSDNHNGGATDTTLWIKNNSYSSGYWACPDEARRLAEWDRSTLNAYLQKLAPVGGTYHDIGMIWGARFASTRGVFADACETYAGMPCNRHVIFMTDGAQTAYCGVYSAYGVERNDMRVMGSTNCSSDSQTNSVTANLLSRHEQRFRMACNATKNLGASVWVIGFDTSLNSNLINCATNAGQADTATNRDALIAKFRAIGNKIGALRLTQ
ncbi:TadE/TadG family protein [Qipengyuania spongiae]|uniref:TadE/TadG family protein n=1 Tax=Qipengyuania spongiae TaxID=2909673 RepID=A0ABY5SX21_9SPHN|nr:TadE/TadG family protein [Qipengyuania spongiae]UVI38705.1 TadE/TadG family protein [Qipengyuania spongiae]